MENDKGYRSQALLALVIALAALSIVVFLLMPVESLDVKLIYRGF